MFYVSTVNVRPRCIYVHQGSLEDDEERKQPRMVDLTVTLNLSREFEFEIKFE